MYPYSPSHLVYTSVHDQKADQRIQRKDFPGIHLDVHWDVSREKGVYLDVSREKGVHLDVSRENLSFELFDLPFDR